MIKEIKKELNEMLIGQEELINEVCNYFYDKIDKQEKSVIFIKGEKDTGKKVLVKKLFELLHKEGKTKSSKIDTIDLGSYNFKFGYNAFLTDLYRSLNSDSEGIIFKNVKKGSKDILNLINSIYPNSCLNLMDNYIMKNDILVRAENDEKSDFNQIVCHSKFFIFVSDDRDLDIEKLFGKDYLNRVDRVFKSKSLTLKERYEIIKRILSSNIEMIKENYKIDLWINLNESIEDGKYDLSKFIYESFRSDEELDIKKYVNYTVLKPVKNLIVRERLEEGSNLIVYRKEDSIYCSDGSEEYNLSNYSDTTLEEAKYKLNSIIGVKELKDFIENVENNVKVQKIRKKLGLKVTSPSLNMIFAGNAGTGKTNAARVTFEYFNALGLLSNGVFREVSKSDFVSENVNDASKVTMDIIDSAMGGVLFIDEAYSLCESEDDKWGKEIVDALLK